MATVRPVSIWHLSNRLHDRDGIRLAEHTLVDFTKADNLGQKWTAAVPNMAWSCQACLDEYGRILIPNFVVYGTNPVGWLARFRWDVKLEFSDDEAIKIDVEERGAIHKYPVPQGHLVISLPERLVTEYNIPDGSIKTRSKRQSRPAGVLAGGDGADDR